MKNKENKTARLLITRLAVQVRLGEPKESKPLREIAKAFFVFASSSGQPCAQRRQAIEPAMVMSGLLLAIFFLLIQVLLRYSL